MSSSQESVSAMSFLNFFAVFACIPRFFCLLWASFIRIFVSDVRAAPKSDIEAGATGAIKAGAPASTDDKKTACSRSCKHDVESGLNCSKSCHSDSSHLSSQNTHAPTFDDTPIPFGSPIRRHFIPPSPSAMPAAATAPGPSAAVTPMPAADTLSPLLPVLKRLNTRGTKKRGSLMDLIRQFPKVPSHLPPGPQSPSSVTSATVSPVPTPSSPASSEGSTDSSDDTADTSAPTSPSTHSDGFGRGKDNMHHFRFGGGYRAHPSLSTASSSSSFGFGPSPDHRRPDSLVWFADKRLNTATKVLEDEAIARAVRRWEESRELGIQALREADGDYPGFFDWVSHRL